MTDTTLLEPLLRGWASVAGQPERLPELLTLYHRDIHFRDPMQEVRGIDAFGESMGHFLKMAQGLELEVEDAFGDWNRGFMVWRMAFRPRLGPPMQVDGTSHLRFEGGKVRYQRDYWDLADSVAGTVPGGRRAWRFMLSPLV